MMLLGMLLLAAGAATPPAPAGRELYQIELKGNQTVWSEGRPVENREHLLFHRYPGGVLMSVKKADVRSVAVARSEASPAKTLRPGEAIEIGQTGGAGTAPAEGGTGSSGRYAVVPGLGERKDGTALLNPDRPYRPDWDTRQVPGLNLALPNSRNDYREGRTTGFPPATAVQSSPGAPPSMPASSGDVPH
ncbi:MAG TPA: hypothetical protein VLO07_01875 [Thermoanaerobaculia bacterium]|nr:hypothetical protein [Thermoanaerobaculia bacterium]